MKREDEHRLLLRARELGLTDGEYVFVGLNHIPPADLKTPWQSAEPGNTAELQEAYRHMLQVYMACLFIHGAKVQCKYLFIFDDYAVIGLIIRTILRSAHKTT